MCQSDNNIIRMLLLYGIGLNVVVPINSQLVINNWLQLIIPMMNSHLFQDWKINTSIVPHKFWKTYEHCTFYDHFAWVSIWSIILVRHWIITHIRKTDIYSRTIKRMCNIRANNLENYQKNVVIRFPVTFIKPLISLLGSYSLHSFLFLMMIILITIVIWKYRESFTNAIKTHLNVKSTDFCCFDINRVYFVCIESKMHWFSTKLHINHFEIISSNHRFFCP